MGRCREGAGGLLCGVQVTELDKNRTARLAAEREYVNLSLGWKSGRFLYAAAREGLLQPTDSLRCGNWSITPAS